MNGVALPAIAASAASIGGGPVLALAGTLAIQVPCPAVPTTQLAVATNEVVGGIGALSRASGPTVGIGGSPLRASLKSKSESD